MDTAQESSSWSRDYGHDAYSNHWVKSANHTLSFTTPTSATQFDTATNRLTAALASYDVAGNQTAFTTAGLQAAMGYDANNLQRYYCAGTTAACNAVNATAEYQYDGDGRRVTKLQAGRTTVFVYDAFGNLAAEYDTQPDPNLMAGTYYRTTDHLGSTRLVTDASGAVVSRRDYFPFGEEIPANATFGSRQLVVDGGAATTYNREFGVHQKFTGSERDTESGLDWLKTRYFSGGQGRFASPDQPFNDQFPEEPRSWNLYTYVRNNPLILVDEDGESATVAGGLLGAIGGGALAWYRGESIVTGAISGAVAGALAGAVIDTAGAALGVYGAAAAGGALGNVGGSAVGRALNGQETTGQDILIDGAVGAAGGLGGAVIGKAAVAVGQRIAGPSVAFETLRPGPYASQSVPATGPRVTPSQAAQLKGQPCHTCGNSTSSATTRGNPIGDHQPSTGLRVRSSSQSILPHCKACSGQQANQVVKQNQIWRQQQTTGAGGGAGVGTALTRRPENEED